MIQYNDLILSGSLNVKDGITGSLFGTASHTLTASYALNSGGALTTKNYQVNFTVSSSASGSKVSGSNGFYYDYRLNTVGIGFDMSPESGNFYSAGENSLVIGYRSFTNAPYTLAHGYWVGVQATGSHAEGNQSSTDAHADYSHAEGWNTVTSGIGAHSEGVQTQASGSYSHAEGWVTVTKGQGSHTEGQYTLATGNFSHAEGYFTTSSGEHSHAEGFQTKALGDYSHAQGEGTTATKRAQAALGTFNKLNNTSSIVVIGNGTSAVSASDLIQFNPDNILSSVLISGSSFTASMGFKGNLEGTASYATTASYADFAVTASYLTGSATASYSITSSFSLDTQLFSGSDYATLLTTGSVGGEQGVTGSLQVAGNLSVLGSASFQYVTSSQVLLNNNTITVQALGLSAPSGGLIVIDSGSQYSSSALFYNVVDEEWTLTKPLNATASYAKNVIGFAQTFTTASTTWPVSHSLGIDFPTVTCWDTSTRRVILPDDIESLDKNNVKIYFTMPITGSVRIS